MNQGDVYGFTFRALKGNLRFSLRHGSNQRANQAAASFRTCTIYRPLTGST